MPLPTDALDRAERELADHRTAIARRAAERAAGILRDRCDCCDLDDHGGEIGIARCREIDDSYDVDGVACGFTAKRCERHGGASAARAVVATHAKFAHDHGSQPKAKGPRRPPLPHQCPPVARRNPRRGRYT